jgi:hypothetical protein
LFQRKRKFNINIKQSRRKKMKKKESGWMNHHCCRGVLLGCLAILTLYGVVNAAQVATSNLTATPSTAKPGAIVKFQADIYYNPAFGEPPGKRLRIFVTRSDYSWVSDKIDITYPGTGSVHVNFVNGFTIPSNAQSGQVYDFYIVYGPWWVISNKASVKVTLPMTIKDMKQKEYIKTAPVK